MKHGARDGIADERAARAKAEAALAAAEKRRDEAIAESKRAREKALAAVAKAEAKAECDDDENDADDDDNYEMDDVEAVFQQVEMAEQAKNQRAQTTPTRVMEIATSGGGAVFAASEAGVYVRHLDKDDLAALSRDVDALKEGVVDVKTGPLLDAIMAVSGVDPKAKRVFPSRFVAHRHRMVDEKGRKINYQKIHEERAVSQLYLALELARRGVGVPVVAVPTIVRNDRGKSIKLYTYLVDDTWTTVAEEIANVAASADRFATTKLSKAMIDALRSASHNGVAIFGTSSSTIMLAEDKLSNGYIARLVGFDSTETTFIANAEKMQRCLYFSSMLLLLNSIVVPADSTKGSLASAQRKVAYSVAREVEKQFAALEKERELDGFCELAFDQTQPTARRMAEEVVLTDLSKLSSRVDHTEFLKNAVSVFFKNLYEGRNVNANKFNPSSKKALQAVVAALLELSGVVAAERDR